MGDAMAETVKSAPAGAIKRRLPDFFIVGHPKSGTTALHQMLSAHPQIHMPLKEPRFFAPELRTRFRSLGPGRLPETLESYLALFAGAGAEQRVGDATPSYLRSETAARRIAEVQPDARIIAVLREPASFLRSFHLQSVHNHTETEKDFQRAITLEPARREGRHIPRFSHSPEALLYSNHVRYVEQLRRYHAAFGPEQVLVLIYDDFRADNAGTVRRVLSFLDLDDPGSSVEVIETKPLPAIRSLTLHQLTRVVGVAHRNPQSRSPLMRTVNTLLPPRLHSDTFGRLWRRLVYTPARPPDAAFMLELRRRFKPEVVALSEYLDRDLVTLWGYDSID